MSETNIPVESPVASPTAVPAGAPAAAPAAVQAPTVYFIDDSATMREVIKIAFRKENLHVVACHDAASAIAQMEQTIPDVVISDVIMPDKDGYEVCQHIKGHPRLAHTPVILMSGVVNRMVADKALAVKADELIRKPFQPQELIARVKQLLKAQGASTTPTPAATAPTLMTAAAPSATAPPATVSATRAWSNLFAANTATDMKRTSAPAPTITAPTAEPALPAAPPTPVVMPVRLTAVPAALPSAPAIPARETAAEPREPATPVRTAAAPTLATQKLHIEVQRLEQLVKKLRSELEAERIYCRSLEESVKTLQEATG